MNNIADIIKTLTDRIRRLETGQEGNGFVPYLFPPGRGSNAMYLHGCHPVLPLNLNDYGWIEITMPRQIANLEEAILLYIPTLTGTWDYSIYTSGGYCGEDESEHTDNMADTGVAVTNDRIECLDITDALTPYHVGDNVGVRVQCVGLDTTTAINLLGVRLR